MPAEKAEHQDTNITTINPKVHPAKVYGKCLDFKKWGDIDEEDDGHMSLVDFGVGKNEYR